MFKLWWNLQFCIFKANFVIFGQKIFFFQTAGQTALIFSKQVPWDDLIQVCSNWDKICNFVFLRIFLPYLVEKSSSKLLVRQLWYLSKDLCSCHWVLCSVYFSHVIDVYSSYSVIDAIFIFSFVSVIKIRNKIWGSPC